MSDTSLHVLIIGGGIGGLCLAQGLRKAGVSVAVYERDRTADARLQGYRLSIEPLGSGSLHECLPDTLWQILVSASGDPGARMGVYDERLRRLMEEDPRDDANDPASGSHAVSRYTLRQVLLGGLSGVVHFDKEFVRYEHNADGKVTAIFADGTSANGDVLVGADGAKSRVRQQLLPHARRIDTPAIGVGGKLPLSSAVEEWLPVRFTKTKNMILPPRDFLFTAVFRRRATPAQISLEIAERVREAGLDTNVIVQDAADEDYIMWAFVAHRRSYPHDIAGLHGKALRDIVLERTKSWHPDLRRLVAESGADTINQFEFAAAARVRPWKSSNVTLLGDAIHYMPPVGGMGGNAALRDATLLCQALVSVHRGRSPLVDALHAYEAEMLDRGFKTVQGVRLYTRMAISRNRPLRTVARAFFRLCGTVGPLRRAVFND